MCMRVRSTRAVSWRGRPPLRSARPGMRPVPSGCTSSASWSSRGRIGRRSRSWTNAWRSSEQEGGRLPAQPAVPSVRAVVFDVGETLIDETTEYGTWADWLGVPRHTFSAVFGAVIALGGDYRETFQHFRPGFDLAVERRRRERAGFPEHFDERDLYPDARPCLEKLRQLG